MFSFSCYCHPVVSTPALCSVDPFSNAFIPTEGSGEESGMDLPPDQAALDRVRAAEEARRQAEAEQAALEEKQRRKAEKAALREKEEEARLRQAEAVEEKQRRNGARFEVSEEDAGATSLRGRQDTTAFPVDLDSPTSGAPLNANIFRALLAKGFSLEQLSMDLDELLVCQFSCASV